jgi:hypothetical protein
VVWCGVVWCGVVWQVQDEGAVSVQWWLPSSVHRHGRSFSIRLWLWLQTRHLSRSTFSRDAYNDDD